MSLSDLAADLDAEVEGWLSEAGITSAAIVAVRDGTLGAKLHGTTSANSARPVDGSTLFDIGSCSKAFTASLAAIFVNEGRLDWDEPLQAIVPEFELYDPWVTAHVTLRDALGNRIGLTRQLPTEFGLDPEVPLPSILARARHIAPAYGFRSRFSYCNLGFLAAALAIERRGGAPYPDLLEERLLRPLGMNRTTSRELTHDDRNRAQGYALIDGAMTEIREDFFGNYEGCGGISSSADDLGRWLLANLGRGSSELPSAFATALFEPQTYVHPDNWLLWLAPPEARFSGYGLGWGVCDFHGRRLVQHSGEGNGMRTHIALLPDAGIGVAICIGNAVPVSVPIAYHVLERLLLGTARDWRMAAEHDQSRRSARAVQSLAPFVVPGDPEPAVDPEAIAGTYSNDAVGKVRVDVDRHIELQIENARLWGERLEPAGGRTFDARYLEAPARAYTTAPSRVTFVIEGGRAVRMEHAALGSLNRISG